MNKILVYSMSVLYLVSGISHFYNPYFYLDIMPSWFTNPEFLVAISGFAEILFAIMLIFKDTRKLSAWLIILMLVVFFVGIHLTMVYTHYTEGNSYLWLSIARLPVQFLLIWWAYKVSKIKRLA